MAISDLVTAVFPITEAKLESAVEFTYATLKANAIARAKRALYRTATVPDEDDIPEVAQYWIADRAVLFLIPVAKDFYMVKERLADSKENANINYYDKVAELDGLKTELEAACKAGLDDALDAIDASSAPEAVKSAPAVSTAGLLVDPTQRAFARGPR
jgi:hypothetical protein